MEMKLFLFLMLFMSTHAIAAGASKECGPTGVCSKTDESKKQLALEQEKAKANQTTTQKVVTPNQPPVAPSNSKK
jgi:hypothetical protein